MYNFYIITLFKRFNQSIENQIKSVHLINAAGRSVEKNGRQIKQNFIKL